MKNTSKAIWDIRKVKIDDAGVKNFYWPLIANEIKLLNDDLLNSYSRVLNENVSKNEFERYIGYYCVSKLFLAEVTSLFRAFLLLKRMKEDNMQIDIPKYWLNTEELWKGEIPSKDNFLSQFSLPASPPSLFSRLRNPKNLFRTLKKLKIGRKGVYVGTLRISNSRELNLDKVIICTQRTNLIEKHAQNVKKKVIYKPAITWFSKVEDKDVENKNFEINNTLQNALIECVLQVCSKRGIVFSIGIHNYLKEILFEGQQTLYNHYQELLSKPSVLPKHIWTGTGGNVWDLLLRLAVMSQGGNAEAHDHGSYSGLTNASHVPFIELWGCNRFITYSKQHARMLKEMIDEYEILEQYTPEIIGLKGCQDEFKKTQIYRSSPIKKVMLISTVYDRDRGRLGEVPAELIKVDLQSRLISQLLAHGYEVIFKAHPESPSLPPEVFKEFGASIEIRPFNEVQEKADLFLFDFVYTTTFQEALNLKRPIVLYDAEGINWNIKGRHMLEHRISIVDGSYDEKNRAQFEWDKIESAFTQAQAKVNDQHFNRYFFLE